VWGGPRQSPPVGDKPSLMTFREVCTLLLLPRLFTLLSRARPCRMVKLACWLLLLQLLVLCAMSWDTSLDLHSDEAIWAR
jgi:hypothetical protein